MNWGGIAARAYLKVIRKMSGTVEPATMRRISASDLRVLHRLAHEMHRFVSEFASSVHDEVEVREAPYGRCSCGCGCPLARVGGPLQ